VTPGVASGTSKSVDECILGRVVGQRESQSSRKALGQFGVGLVSVDMISPTVPATFNGDVIRLARRPAPTEAI
jgi:hypothetical protein